MKLSKRMMYGKAWLPCFVNVLSTHLKISAWSFPASCPSLALAHCQVICLSKKWPYFRFKRLLTRVEHAHPQHSAIHRVRHDLIEGSEVIGAFVFAADRCAVGAGRQRAKR